MGGLLGRAFSATGFDRFERLWATGSIHVRAKFGPARRRSLRPTMFTMQAFRHTERAAMHHFVGHGSIIPTDRTSHGLHRAKSGGKSKGKSLVPDVDRFAAFSAMCTPLDGNGNAGEHSLDAFALRLVSFAQPETISRTGQTLSSSASRTNPARLSGPNEARG